MQKGSKRTGGSFSNFLFFSCYGEVVSFVGECKTFLSPNISQNSLIRFRIPPFEVPETLGDFRITIRMFLFNHFVTLACLAGS